MGGLALLVDSNLTVQRVIAAMLQRHGFEPLVASDSHRALELARSSKKPLTLAILDRATLQDQWIDLEQKLRADPRHRTLPLVLTATTEVLSERVVTLRKPFDPTSLQRAIQEASQRTKAPPPSQRVPSSVKGSSNRPPLTSVPVVQEASEALSP
ncbi:MAG: hypothetical protein RMJ98_14140, partial [Myxococcales bacterium]|nr:hypothetical protein [Polyangiaceae bacterium]MDW8250432.1 hypothetical protein [Myxococcales bacterium]